MMASVYPFPVYVATFADGTVARMSFWNKAGKPWDFASGRRLLAWAVGAGRDRAAAAEYAATCVSTGIGVCPPEAWFASLQGRRFLRSVAARLLDDIVPELGGKLATWFRERLGWPVAEDMIAGHVEHDGKRFDDPEFAPAPSNVVALPKRRATAAELQKAL